MADVIGPNSYLPGQKLKVPEGMLCDECCVAHATIRVVGETDSFGSEIEDYCQACWDVFEENAKRAKEENPDADHGICDRCHCSAVCKPTRDATEGRCGPVYWYCEPCMDRHREQQRASFDDDIDDDYEDEY